MNTKEYMGYVYFLQYGDFVKIGCTKQPYKRIMTLYTHGTNYANKNITRVAITEQHTNYRENESVLHKLYNKYRICGTELFDISFEELDVSNSIALLDDSVEIMKKEQEIITLLKQSLYDKPMLGLEIFDDFIKNISNDNLKYYLNINDTDSWIDISDFFIDRINIVSTNLEFSNIDNMQSVSINIFDIIKISIIDNVNDYFRYLTDASLGYEVTVKNGDKIVIMPFYEFV